MRDDLSLAEAAAAVRDRKVSSEALTLVCLDQFEASQGRINAAIAIHRDRALADARAADKALAAGAAIGPLHGVPLAHKDMFYRTGEVSTCGSFIRRNDEADRTATVLTRLDAAGAIDVGNLNMAEFASNPTGQNAHWGDCRNPWDPEHITGGSSSGSAAAVAARLVYGALGSDTGGSVRLPAAACGVTGLKPTQTRVSRYGVMPLSHSLDVVGPLARTARDCALLLGIIGGADPLDASCSRREVPDYDALLDGNVRGLRIGVAESYFFADVATAIGACINEAIREFERLGAVIVPVTVSDMPAINALQLVVQRTELAAKHKSLMHKRAADYDPQVREGIEVGFAIPAALYAEACSVRGAMLMKLLATTYAQVDVLLTPTISMATPKRTQTAHSNPASGALLQQLTRCTRPINYLGLPSLSLPCGFVEGLPVGLQLIGTPFGEAQLLCAGDAYQRSTDWHRLAPPG